jgi:flagellar secretion chaperone FliS
MATNYSDSYLEAQVDSASPLQLVDIAYQTAIAALDAAREHLRNGRIAERAKSITRVTTILMELSAALDHKAAPEMSLQLARLYEYMTHRLREANFQQSEKPLIEVEGLLRTLGEAWSQIAAADAGTGHPPVMSRPQEPAPAAENPWAQPAEPRSSNGAVYTF